MSSVWSYSWRLEAGWCRVQIVVGATDFVTSGVHLASSELGTWVLSGGKVAKV